MNESADVSDLAFLSKPEQVSRGSEGVITRHPPNMTLQQFKTQIILSLGARYDLIFKSSAVHQHRRPSSKKDMTNLAGPV
jgi:hypothetical protein